MSGLNTPGGGEAGNGVQFDNGAFEIDQSSASVGPLEPREYMLRDRNSMVSYTSQMTRVGYRVGYQQYTDWEPRPARRVFKRGRRVNPDNADFDEAGITEMPILGSPDQEVGGELSEAGELLPQVPDSPGTPLQVHHGLVTPQTERRYSPTWQESTASQVGFPSSDDLSGHGPYVWEDSIFRATNQDEMPQRSHIRGSEIETAHLLIP